MGKVNFFLKKKNRFRLVKTFCLIEGTPSFAPFEKWGQKLIGYGEPPKKSLAKTPKKKKKKLLLTKAHGNMGKEFFFPMGCILFLH